jgi:hypothetical protein
VFFYVNGDPFRMIFLNIKSPILWPTMTYDFTTNKLNLLTAREQLMEDIDCILDEYFQEYGITHDPQLVKVLCDAVCNNFPF